MVINRKKKELTLWILLFTKENYFSRGVEKTLLKGAHSRMMTKSTKLKEALGMAADSQVTKKKEAMRVCMCVDEYVDR